MLHLRRSSDLARVIRTIEPDRDIAATSLPIVSVLAPCRGGDDDFEAYARALLSQAYAEYEVLFVVESTADPVWRH